MNKNSLLALIAGASALAITTAQACQEVCPEANNHGLEDCPEPEGEPHDNLPDPEGEFSQQELDFCTCMLRSCHDPFHDEYGGDDIEARDNCLLEISAVPSTGTPATSGNSQECRAHFCASDPDRDCDAALGKSICL